MSCDSTKCSQCPSMVKRCTLVQGMCVFCYGKKIKNAQTAPIIADKHLEEIVPEEPIIDNSIEE